MKYNIHSIDLREGKYEILYEVLDDNDNLIVGNLIHSMTDKYPDKKDLDVEFNNVIFGKIEKILLEENNSSRFYSPSEITQILRGKKYFTTEEFSEDMPDKG